MVIQYFLLQANNDGNKFNLIIEPELGMDQFNKIGADFEEKNKQPQNNFLNFNHKKAGFQNTFNGEYKLEPKFSNGQISLEVDLKVKNNLNAFHDFLNDANATIILAANVVEKNGKSVLELKFYSSEYEKGKVPRFIWEREIPSDIQWDFSKSLTFGTTKSDNQKKIDENQRLVRSFTGITFKGFALFEKPKTDQEYNDVFEKFRKQYIE